MLGEIALTISRNSYRPCYTEPDIDTADTTTSNPEARLGLGQDAAPAFHAVITGRTPGRR